MGDMAEGFRAMREYSRQKRDERYKRNMSYINKVTGYVLTEITPYQFRFFGEGVGNFCDLYPTNQRYHNLITGERGRYKTAQGFLDTQYNKAKELKDAQTTDSNID